MVIFINPDCSKCREAIGILDGASCDYEIRNYLEVPPGREELKDLISKLGCRAEDLVRKSDDFFVQHFSSKNISEEEWLTILIKNPILLQRPIVVDGKKAVIGRPPVLILDLLRKD